MSAREFAVDFLENLVSFFGVNVLVESEEDEEDNVVMLNVPSTHLNGFFIGQKGDNLHALQNLTNMALKSNGYEDVSVTVDVAGYKKQRNQRLQKEVGRIAEGVKESGEDHEMEPMNAYERRITHRAIGDIEGVESESTGEGRDRKVVIKKSKETGEKEESEDE